MYLCTTNFKAINIFPPPKKIKTVTVKDTLFSDMTPYRLAENYQRLFGPHDGGNSLLREAGEFLRYTVASLHRRQYSF